MTIGSLLNFRKPFSSSESSNQLHRVYRNGKVRFWLRPNPQDPSLIKTFQDSLCRKGRIKLFNNSKCVIVDP